MPITSIINKEYQRWRCSLKGSRDLKQNGKWIPSNREETPESVAKTEPKPELAAVAETEPRPHTVTVTLDEGMPGVALDSDAGETDSSLGPSSDTESGPDPESAVKSEPELTTLDAIPAKQKAKILCDVEWLRSQGMPVAEISVQSAEFAVPAASMADPATAAFLGDKLARPPSAAPKFLAPLVEAEPSSGGGDARVPLDESVMESEANAEPAPGDGPLDRPLDGPLDDPKVAWRVAFRPLSGNLPGSLLATFHNLPFPYI